MADIFISYGRPDVAHASKLAEILSSLGWSVWWDRELLAGSSFDDAIEAELQSASCVIVLWSRASTSSTYVKAEAAEGLQRNVLVPVSIEDARIPLPFRRLHTVSWTSSLAFESSDEFLRIATAIFNLTGKPPNPDRLHTFRSRVASLRTPGSDLGPDPFVASAALLKEEAKPPPALYALLLLSAPFSVLTSLDLVPGLSFSTKPILITLLVAIGHLYGPRVAMQSGLIVFTPGIASFLLMVIIDGGALLGGTWPEGSTPSFLRQRLGLAGLAYVFVGVVTSKARQWIERESRFSLIYTKNRLPPIDHVALFLVAAACSISVDLPSTEVILDVRRLFYAVPFAASLLFDFDAALRLAATLSPWLGVSFSRGGLLMLPPTPFADLTPLVAYVSLSLIARTPVSAAKQTSAAPLFVLFLLVGMLPIASIELSLAKWLTLSSSGFGIASIIVIGRMYGSHRGFLAGVMWALFSIPDVSFGTTSFGPPEYVSAVVPVLGFLGGSELFHGNFRRLGFRLILLLFLSYSLSELLRTIAWTTGLAVAPSLQDFGRQISAVVDLVVGLIAFGVLSSVLACWTEEMGGKSS